jgi:hypothetical protein
MRELYFHSPNTSSWRGAQLKHRDNFTFYLDDDDDDDDDHARVYPKVSGLAAWSENCK